MSRTRERKRNPAAPGDHPLDPQRRVDARQERTGHAAQAPPKDTAARRMQSTGSRSSAPNPGDSPTARSTSPARGYGRETRRATASRSATIDERVLLEERGAENGMSREQRDPDVALASICLADVRYADERGKPAPKRLSASPVAYWFVPCQITSARRSERPQSRARAPAANASRDCRGGTPAANPAMRADQHHPFGPQVEHAGLLVDELAHAPSASGVPAMIVAASSAVTLMAPRPALNRAGRTDSG